MKDEAHGRTLAVDDVDVDLGGVAILRGVTFDVRPGEIFGIIGPNGAGKTTVLNVVGGVVRPTAGSVRFGETSLLGTRPHRMRDYGIGRSLQSMHYFRDITALQLVALAELPNSMWGALRFGGHRSRDETTRARSVLASFGLLAYADRPLSELSSAVQKLADMCRAVVAGTELLLLDEPTSGVSAYERDAIGEALGRLGELGRSIVLIDHDPGFVTSNCHRVMAMNFGQVLDIGQPEDIMTSDAVKQSYLGEAVESA